MNDPASAKSVGKADLLFLPLACIALLGCLYLGGLVLFNRWIQDVELPVDTAAMSPEPAMIPPEVPADPLADGEIASFHHGIDALTVKSITGGSGLDDLADAWPWVRTAGLFDTFGNWIAGAEFSGSSTTLNAKFREALEGKLGRLTPAPDGEGGLSPDLVLIYIPLFDEVGQPSGVILATGDLTEAPASLGDYLRVDPDTSIPPPVAVLAPDPGPGAAAGAGDGRAVLRALWLRATQFHAIGSVVTLALLALIGLRMTRRLFSPIHATVEAAERVSKGELDVAVSEEGPAEVRSIATAFNHMISEVRYHRDTLSNLVQSRTRNLESARKMLEWSSQQLRASYDSSRDAVMIVDAVSMEILQANQTLLSMFDIGDVNWNELSSSDFAEVLESMFGDPADFHHRWTHYEENPDEEGSEEWVLVRPRRRILTVFTAPVRSEDGRAITGRLWTFRDITEQRELEEKLRRSQTMEAMGHLSGTLAHDFNNLLTVVLGNLSLAKLEIEDQPEVQEHLHAAEEATSEATDLAKKLMGLSHKGARLDLTAMNVNDVVEEVCDVLRATADARISISTELHEALWEAPADAAQIRQAVMNVCMNAVDAMAEGGCVTVGTENIAVASGQLEMPPECEPGEYVRISVTDTGPGMPEHIRDRAFEPFFTTKQDAGSQGLGLAMAYGAINKHGGWMRCTSELGKGSRFEMYLMRAETRSKPVIIAQRSEDSGGQAPVVLVVDDESGVRRIAVSVLKRMSCATMEACDGEEAVKVFQQEGHAIDLVLLDLSMPKLSGRETFTALKGMNPDLPVVLCSGYPIDAREFEAETGFAPIGVIQKPFDVTGLIECVKEALSKAVAEPVTS